MKNRITAALLAQILSWSEFSGYSLPNIFLDIDTLNCRFF
jgi:hypothetical protein